MMTYYLLVFIVYRRESLLYFPLLSFYTFSKNELSYLRGSSGQ